MDKVDCVLNPITGRAVKANGRIGKKILASQKNESKKPHTMYKKSEDVRPNKKDYENKIRLINDWYDLTLQQRNNHRKDIIEKYEKELDEIKSKTTKKTPTGKQSGIDRNREWTIRTIIGVGKMNFKDEEEEYKFINKYPRGLWRFIESDSIFDDKEKKLLISIAKNFGAFKY
jgi:hypothetical protein